MYTIRTAAARAGVSTEAVRAWERRYGVVHPHRSDNGYRVYDEDAIARLVAMRQLIDAGWSAGLAAQHVIEHGPDLDASLTAGAGRDTGRGTDAQGAGSDLIRAFVSAAAEMDGAAVDRVLDEMFARGTFERVTDDLVYPALRQVGERWQSGELSVAAEHAASHAVTRRLAQLFDAAGRLDSGRPRLVVGMPPGARHEVGALGFAVAARRAGYAVTYVGADLPVADWVKASAGADGLVLGVVVKSDVAAAVNVSKAVRAEHPGMAIALGGPNAPAGEGHVRLPAGLADALAALSNALNGAAD